MVVLIAEVAAWPFWSSWPCCAGDDGVRTRSRRGGQQAAEPRQVAACREELRRLTRRALPASDGSAAAAASSNVARSSTSPSRLAGCWLLHWNITTYARIRRAQMSRRPAARGPVDQATGGGRRSARPGSSGSGGSTCGRCRSPRGSACGSGSRSAGSPGSGSRRAAPPSEPFQPAVGSGGGTARSRTRACRGAPGLRRSRRASPNSTSWPRYITATRDAMCRTTARLCAMNTMVSESSSRRSASRFRTCAWIETSSALTGSSATTNSARARAPGRSRSAGAGRRRTRRESGWRRRAGARPGCSISRDALLARAARTVAVRAQRLGDDRADLHARVQRRVRVLEDHLGRGGGSV